MRNYYLPIFVFVLFYIITPVLAFADANVTVSVLADRSLAKTTDTVTYKVIASNPKDRAIENARIIVTIPPYLLPLATSPEANANPQNRTLSWNSVLLSPNSSTTLSFRAKPTDDAPPGNSLSVSARINGDGVNDTSNASVTVAAAPQTITTSTVETTARTGSELFWVAGIASLGGLIGLYRLSIHYL